MSKRAPRDRPPRPDPSTFSFDRKNACLLALTQRFPQFGIRVVRPHAPPLARVSSSRNLRAPASGAGSRKLLASPATRSYSAVGPTTKIHPRKSEATPTGTSCSIPDASAPSRRRSTSACIVIRPSGV